MPASKKRKPRPNLDQRGRNPVQRHIRIYFAMLESIAYRSLSLAARALLTELIKLDRGQNNGAIWLSIADAQALLGLSDHRAVSRAFDELQDRGFIRMMAEFKWGATARMGDAPRARQWRLTFEPVPGKCAATHEWQRYTPVAEADDAESHAAVKRLRKRIEAAQRVIKRQKQNRFSEVDSTIVAVVDSTIDQSESGKPVVDSTIAKLEKSRVCDFQQHGEFPHLYCISQVQKHAPDEVAAIVRTQLQHHLASTGQTQRQFCRQPAILKARMTESWLSKFMNRPRSKIRPEIAAAIMAAMGGPHLERKEHHA